MSEQPVDPQIRRPDSADLCRGGRYGNHVRPEPADDERIQFLVQSVFAPRPRFPGLRCPPPQDALLVQQLLDRAPRPEAIGLEDGTRPLRADEVAEIWGTPMEGPDVRLSWLRRADEIARAWGKPLFGAGGLLPETSLEEAAR